MSTCILLKCESRKHADFPAFGRPGTHLKLGLTKKTINSARQLSRRLVYASIIIARNKIETVWWEALCWWEAWASWPGMLTKPKALRPRLSKIGLETGLGTLAFLPGAPCAFVYVCCKFTLFFKCFSYVINGEVNNSITSTLAIHVP